MRGWSIWSSPEQPRNLVHSHQQIRQEWRQIPFVILHKIFYRGCPKNIYYYIVNFLEIMINLDNRWKEKKPQNTFSGEVPKTITNVWLLFQCELPVKVVPLQPSIYCKSHNWSFCNRQCLIHLYISQTKRKINKKYKHNVKYFRGA